MMFIGDFVPKAEPGFRLAAALKERGHEPLVVSWRFQGGVSGDGFSTGVSTWGSPKRACWMVY